VTFRLLYLIFVRLCPPGRRLDGAAHPERAHGPWRVDQRPEILIRDRDSKVHQRVRRCFTATGMRIIKTPVQEPRANAICERWIASARCQCTDRILIAGRRHLHHSLSEYADHYNTHRPHRILSQQPPDGRTLVAPADGNTRVLGRGRLGGLLHEYSQVA
jgi:putative transposase